jgi:hypothetical protein
MNKLLYLDDYRPKENSKNCGTCNLPPKGCEWKVIYRHWNRKGVTTYEAFVFDYEKGLTAYEAYEKAD